jgi:peroxiredoxin
VAATIVVAALALGAYLSFGQHDTPQPAPDVAYTLLDGTRSSTGQQRGKVVLLNFWATSCTTCVKEMPQIIATHEMFKSRGLRIVAVAMRHDPPAAVAHFAQTRQLPFGVAIDNTGAIARGFGEVELTPTTVLINKRGEIVRTYVGTPNFAALHRLVEKLLLES